MDGHSPPSADDDVARERVPSAMARPFKLALARAVHKLPAPGALAGGTVYEPKWDGFRLVIAHDGDRMQLWSRQKKDLTSAFPDVASVAWEMLPAGLVTDGEVVRWNENRLDFDALQRRLTATPRSIDRLVDTEPVSYVAFDLLAVAGRDLRGHPYRVRRALLEELCRGWQPPFTLCPSTTDIALARQWFSEYPVAGVEGIVAKGADQPYPGGRREWLKVKHRDTFELVCGAVTGALNAPKTLILGRYYGNELRIVGRTAPLAGAAEAGLGRQLRPPRKEHPWPTVIRSSAYDRFSPKKDTPLTLVEPLVVEVSADTALSGGSLRHPARYLRVRPELRAEDINETRLGPR
jgi:ATP-dependent DNA ligase